MENRFAASRSMAMQFTRNYLLISIIPIAIVFVLFFGGIFIIRGYLAELITESTYDLNKDAEKNLQKLGERYIRTIARDVARQVEIYIRSHKGMNIHDMRNDPFFMSLAMQKVGETGYTSIYEAGTWIFRVHPDKKLVDKNVEFLSEKLPAWWKIVGATYNGDEVSGYYDWRDPDGDIRKKYMTITPVMVRLHGKILMVAATTYIDEFSLPVIAMNEKADQISADYQKYISRSLVTVSIIFGLVIILSYLGTYFMGRRAALRYILPIMQLAETSKELGEGKWDASAHKEVLQRDDEIGVLAHSLDMMSQKIKVAFRDLEERLVQLNQAQGELKKSEENFKILYEESKRSEEVYKSLINSSADAILFYDLDGNVTYSSPMFTSIFGWEQDEILNKRIPFVPEDRVMERESVIKDVLINGNPRQGFETVRLTKDGRNLNVNISASRYNDHEGKPAGILIIIRDITEAKKLEEHLKQVERLESIGTLAGGIAHDFNNLLMVIQGTISILTYETPVSDPNYNHFLNIEKQVQLGSRLTRQLLGYARKGKYEIKAVDLNRILKENVETLQRTRKEIIINFDLDQNLLAVEVDNYQIEQVLINLYINAVDSMSGSGNLSLKTRNVTADEIKGKVADAKNIDYVALTVSDTGTGMDKKTMEHIFEPFFTTKTMERGTGLGLASVYGIVKSHDGFITVESELGMGTTFTIYLPASEKGAITESVSSQETPRGRGTLLLTDDESAVLDISAQMLSSMGYTVFKADNGQKSIELYSEMKDSIDLVILDMIMPDMSGSEIFDRLKEINPDVAVLLSSGYSIQGKATEILKRGCRGFIQKPYKMDEIAEKIESILKDL